MSQEFEFFSFDEALIAPNGQFPESSPAALPSPAADADEPERWVAPRGAVDPLAAPGLWPESAPNGPGTEATTPRVVVVDADPAVREYLVRLLEEGRFPAVAVADLTEFRAVADTAPAVGVLGPFYARPEALTQVERLTASQTPVATVLVAAELTTQLLQRALRAGVKDVLAAPIEAPLLHETVARVVDGLSSATAVAQAPPLPAPQPTMGNADEPLGRVITVFSTKGGSGKSITATNLAVILARESSRPVILVDGHLQFGDVAVMLKLNPEHTVIDAIARLDSLDAAMIERLLTVHEPSGLHVLAAPHEPTFSDRISGGQVAELIDCFRHFAGHVIIDLPAIFNEVVLSVVEVSDDIMLVAELDVPNIKNVKIGLSTLDLLNIPKERLHLVLNRADSKVKLNVAEVERTLGIAAVARVPSDVVVPISVNRGSPVVLSSPKSGVARAFERLALRFLHDAPGDVVGASSLRRLFG